jgi:hypothetical protein
VRETPFALQVSIETEDKERAWAIAREVAKLAPEVVFIEVLRNEANPVFRSIGSVGISDARAST